MTSSNFLDMLFSDMMAVELQETREELNVYVEMQETLNRNLSGQPELQSYIEEMQTAQEGDSYCFDPSLDTQGEIKDLRSVLTKYLNKFDQAETKAADYQYSCERWKQAYAGLKADSTKDNGRDYYRDLYVKESEKLESLEYLCHDMVQEVREAENALDDVKAELHNATNYYNEALEMGTYWRKQYEIVTSRIDNGENFLP